MEVLDAQMENQEGLEPMKRKAESLTNRVAV
jgi:hypothetical protein